MWILAFYIVYIRALDPDMDIKTMHTLYLDAAPGTFERILDSVKRDLNK